jgi:hypothetical protein
MIPKFVSFSRLHSLLNTPTILSKYGTKLPKNRTIVPVNRTIVPVNRTIVPKYRSNYNKKGVVPINLCILIKRNS